ncbi:kynureninase [Caballeronia sordidicola]|uniref:kynureninase n=1 Tax=Caballeronia sordidicola TaxID=196367 RepID=UPI0004CFF755|nr:kynureninase [Caballeronia sordidicola]
MPISATDADALDRADPLHSFRADFDLPEGVIYLDGNSLGALPRATAERMHTVVTQEWGHDLIRSWNAHNWIDAPTRVGDKIAQLIGAGPGEVVVADSTSVNLFKVLSAALQINQGRSVILSEPGNFPNDLYIAQGLQALSGGRVELRIVERERLAESIDEDVAVLMLTHVHYKTAAMHDMSALTGLAHSRGALAVWDLSHSAGAVHVDLEAAQADFAVGCGYKYLNGGPGSPAYLYVARRHQASAVSPIAGWLGHKQSFEFVDEYQPAAGIERYLAGAHPILGICALEVGVDLMLRAAPATLYAKSKQLCTLFAELAQQRCGIYGVESVLAADSTSRGSHVSLRHPHAYSIMQALIARGVIGDFRAPDILRFGLTPLYVGFRDVWDAVDILADVLRTNVWQLPKFQQRHRVT